MKPDPDRRERRCSAGARLDRARARPARLAVPVVDATAGGLDGIDAGRSVGLITLGGRAPRWRRTRCRGSRRTAADGAVPRAATCRCSAAASAAGPGARARRDGATHAAGEYGWLDISPVGRGQRATRCSRLAATADPVYLLARRRVHAAAGAVHLATSARDADAGVPPRPRLGPAVPPGVRPAAVRRLAQRLPRCLRARSASTRRDAADGGRRASAIRRSSRCADRRVRVGRAHVAPAGARYRRVWPCASRAARRALARARPDRGPAGRARRADVPDRAPRRRRARAGRRGPARAGDGVAAEGRRLLVVGRAHVPAVRDRRHHAEGETASWSTGSGPPRSCATPRARRGRLPAGRARRTLAVLRELSDAGSEIVEARCDRGASIVRALGFPDAAADAVFHWTSTGTARATRRARPAPRSAAGPHRGARPVGRRLLRRPGRAAAREMVRERSGRWFDRTSPTRSCGSPTTTRCGTTCARRAGRARARPRPAGLDASPTRPRSTASARPSPTSSTRSRRSPPGTRAASRLRAADRRAARPRPRTSCATCAGPGCCTTSASSASRTDPRQAGAADRRRVRGDARHPALHRGDPRGVRRSPRSPRRRRAPRAHGRPRLPPWRARRRASGRGARPGDRRRVRGADGRPPLPRADGARGRARDHARVVGAHLCPTTLEALEDVAAGPPSSERPSASAQARGTTPDPSRMRAAVSACLPQGIRSLLLGLRSDSRAKRHGWSQTGAPGRAS